MEYWTFPNLAIDHLQLNRMLARNPESFFSLARNHAESPQYSVLRNVIGDQITPRILTLALKNTVDSRSVTPHAKRYLSRALDASILCVDNGLNKLIGAHKRSLHHQELAGKNKTSILQAFQTTIELASDGFCSYTGPFNEDALFTLARSAVSTVEGSGDVSAILCDYFEDVYMREVKQSASTCLNIDALAMGAIGATCMLANGALRDRFSILPEIIEEVPENWK